MKGEGTLTKEHVVVGKCLLSRIKLLGLRPRKSIQLEENQKAIKPQKVKPKQNKRLQT
jgi:hypothetical protein